MLPRRSLAIAAITSGTIVLVLLFKLNQNRSSIRRSISDAGVKTRPFVCTKYKTVKPRLRSPIPEDGQFLPAVAGDELEHPTNYTTSKPLFAPPLRTQGRYILDANGRRFKLASINWYGASDKLFVPGGLDHQHRSIIAEEIRRMGFNSVRLPYSDELVLCDPIIEPRLVAANPDLAGKTALDVLEACVSALTDAGLAVIINNHITQAGWFDGYNLCDATWSNAYLGPFCRISQTEDSWIKNWEEVMRPFVSNPRVIGADLRNEIHGFWGTVRWSSWAVAAEKAGNRLLALQPYWLIFVEGLSSANDLSGARTRPIKLNIRNRVVYSSHVYSWSGWGEFDPFSQRAYDSFASKMDENWGYLLREGIAPVWVGEFGSPEKPDKGSRHYWNNLMRFLQDVDADFGYWALNPTKPATGEHESYTLLEKDWSAAISNDYRLQDMNKLMGKD